MRTRITYIPFLLALIMGFANGCKDQPTESPTAPPQSGIVPLQMGYQWIYEVTHYDTVGTVLSITRDTTKVVRVVQISGERWFDFGNGVLRTNRDSGLWEMFMERSYLLYHYPGEVGEKAVTPDVEIHIEKVDETVSSPIGKFPCYVYTVHFPWAPNVVGQRVFASSEIGVIRADEWVETHPYSGAYFLYYRKMLLSFSGMAG